MPDLAIRPYEKRDMGQLYRICLETGKDGKDATGTVDDEILGHIYAAPYATFEPDLCFVVDNAGTAIGYILGTRDSKTFAETCEQKWWPHLREKYPLFENPEINRTALLTQAIHSGYQAPSISIEFPAHLHIDILPAGQGKGFGRLLIKLFTEKLREYSVPALHFGVSRKNISAIGFYKKLGFQILEESETSCVFGMKLN
jgi:ribosomal protein S18 acetylase RimI-like enzyme